MDEQLKQIGERLRGLRDVLDITTEEVAALCGITVEHYEQMENGESELSVANLQKIAKQYGVSLDVLMFGEEPKMSSYFLTRKGHGMSVERRKAYNYESLASGFRGRKADPFIVTVEPKPADTPKEMNSHSGQEFNMVLEGTLQLTIGTKSLTLNEGDSIYYDSSEPHDEWAVGGRESKSWWTSSKEDMEHSSTTTSSVSN